MAASRPSSLGVALASSPPDLAVLGLRPSGEERAPTSPKENTRPSSRRLPSHPARLGISEHRSPGRVLPRIKGHGEPPEAGDSVAYTPTRRRPPTRSHPIVDVRS